MSELLEIAERVAGMAQAGEEVEAYVARGRTTHVQAYEGEIEELTSAESWGIGVRVIKDHRQGFASAGSLDDDVVAETLAEARDNAAFGEPDEWYGLATPNGAHAVDLDLWNEAVVQFPNDRKIELALELERKVRAADPRIVGVRAAAYHDGAGESAVATSTGVSSTWRSTSCSVGVSALAKEGDESTIAGGGSGSRDPEQLDLEVAVNEAVERATRMLGATKPSSQRLTIFLEPRMASTLLGIVSGMLTGSVLVKGRTPFADRVGEQIASPVLTLVDDPTDGRSMAAHAFDGEGLPTRRNALIEDGVLQGFLHNTYTGRRTGTASTGSAARGYGSTPGVSAGSLWVTPGELDSEQLIAGIEHGLFVQSMAGLHSGVNAISGDFSVGIEGLMIRNGQLAEPVREGTVASTLQRLLLDIDTVGATEWLPYGVPANALVVRDVTLSGS